MTPDRQNNGIRIAILTFSATGNTAKISREVAGTLTRPGAEITEMDITPATARQKEIDPAGYDALIIGMPVHSWRAPRIVREWIRLLDGTGKKCATFFTYGGFGIHPAHHSTRNLLEQQGFTLVSSAEFLAAHTFNLGGWKAMENRPDESDAAVAREFAELTFRRFSGEDSGLPGPFEATDYPEELLDRIEGFRFRILTSLPGRHGAACCMCMACEENCPAQAFDATTGTACGDRCIACLGCVARCPEEAIIINDMTGSWEFKLKGEGITIPEMEAKQSRIYL